MKFLSSIAAGDVATLLIKDKSYGGSWKKRGGVGAFMMLARKWDRTETQTERSGYDIFEAVSQSYSAALENGEPVAESLIGDIRDLRCYLMLVEDHLIQQGVVEPAFDFTKQPLPDGMSVVFGNPPANGEQVYVNTEAVNDQSVYQQMAVGGYATQETYDEMPPLHQERMFKVERDEGRVISYHYIKVGHPELVRDLKRMVEFRKKVRILMNNDGTRMDQEAVDALADAIRDEANNKLWIEKLV